MLPLMANRKWRDIRRDVSPTVMNFPKWDPQDGCPCCGNKKNPEENYQFSCPTCGREGCPECIPDGRGADCPECQENAAENGDE